MQQKPPLPGGARRVPVQATRGVRRARLSKRDRSYISTAASSTSFRRGVDMVPFLYCMLLLRIMFATGDGHEKTYLCLDPGDQLTVVTTRGRVAAVEPGTAADIEIVDAVALTAAEIRGQKTLQTHQSSWTEGGHLRGVFLIAETVPLASVSCAYYT